MQEAMRVGPDITPFNRTSMELKPPRPVGVSLGCKTFNRTSMELKLVYRVRSYFYFALNF